MYFKPWRVKVVFLGILTFSIMNSSQHAHLGLTFSTFKHHTKVIKLFENVLLPLILKIYLFLCYFIYKFKYQ